MSNSTLSKEQLALLTKPLPDKAVTPHPTKPHLSTIKAVYVTERFNEVFGTGKWSIETDLLHHTSEEKQSKTRTYKEYMAVCKTTFTVPEYGIKYECVAGSSNEDLGDAAKGATTDAITKIGSYIGIGIDVFKGLHGKGGPEKSPKQDTPPTTPDKPWLNESDPKYAEVVEKIKAKTVTIDKVKEHFKISKATEAKLLQL